MAVPKIVSPRGKLLLAIGVAISACLASSQPIHVVEPLTHRSTGCPYLFYFQSNGGCRRLYRAVNDNAWFPVDGYGRNVVDRSLFSCCAPKDFIDGHVCQQSFSSGAEVATCVLADNYCPTLEIVSAENDECIGTYSQATNSTWNKEGGSGGLAVRVAGREAYDENLQTRKLKFECYNGKTNIGAVKEFKCHNPLLPDGLKYGVNKVKYDLIYVVGHKGPSKMSEGSFFRSFEVTTTTRSSEDKLWVWPLGSRWKKDETVVIAQIFNDDEAQATVELSDVHETTFKLRLPHAWCHPKHQKERVNILQMQIGVHKGTDGQLVAVNKTDVTGKPSIKRFPAEVDFTALPVVFTQIQKVIKGPEHGYLHSKVVSRDRSQFEVQLQQLDGYSADAFSATVGYIAVTVGSHNRGLFGTHYVVVHREDSAVPSRVSFDAAGFLRTPLVFVETQTNEGGHSLVERLTSASAEDAEFKLVDDRCDLSKTAEYGKEGVALLAIGEASTVTKPEDQLPDFDEWQAEDFLAPGDSGAVPPAPAEPSSDAKPEGGMKPEDCVLIFDNDVPGIYVHNGAVRNGSPVYQRVSRRGALQSWYLTRSGEQWNYQASIEGGSRPPRVLGNTASADPVCPADGSPFTRSTTGKVFRAMAPLWALCYPTRGVCAGHTAAERMANADSLTECARLVISKHPAASGADWQRDTSHCRAVWGEDIAIVPSMAGHMACVFQCNLLPGCGTAGNEVGISETAQECADLVRRSEPSANAMSYGGHRSKTCVAVLDDGYPDLSGAAAKEFRTCWLGGMPQPVKVSG